VLSQHAKEQNNGTQKGGTLCTFTAGVAVGPAIATPPLLLHWPHLQPKQQQASLTM
jgi:hypothetical protein